MSSAPKLSTLTPHVLEPGYYWDSRHENDPQPRGDWVRFFDPNNNPPILFEKCSSSNPMEAYTYAAQVKPQDGSPEYQESVVAFCNSHRDKWLHRTSQGDTPSVYHDGIAMPNGMHVDYIWDYLARTIVHEFTHSAVLLQGRKDANGNDINAELVDMCLLDNRKVYQWECIHQLSVENPPLATVNSDTFALFATAIYINGNDWSTGLSRPLGEAKP